MNLYLWLKKGSKRQGFSQCGVFLGLCFFFFFFSLVGVCVFADTSGGGGVVNFFIEDKGTLKLRQRKEN